MRCSIGRRTVGAASVAFCMGMICGLLLPLTAVLIVETTLLFTVGYLCLFKW